MKKNKFLNWAAAAALAGLAMVSGGAMAQTPDGETPANEGACDVLKASGVTPSLYGLCVAYCEAQDLDTFDKEPPNTKILDNYNKRKQAADPAMPCIKVPCPCWTAEEIASISGDATAAACNSATNKLQIIDIAPRTHFAEANTNVGTERCRYIDLNTSPTTIRSFTITQEQAQSCMMDVQAACQATGF
jgi:hypothetical protein